VGSLIEAPKFPVEAVNKASASEKGAGRPKHWEMVFWWTRKPLAGARAVIAGALVPGTVEPEEFLRWVYPGYRGNGEFARTPHRGNPDLPAELREKFRSVKLLDPFAGFGSIPLEAVRLGVGEVVAVELLPTAYIFLKAILEYPKAYGELRVKARGGELKELGLEGVARRLAKARRVGEGGVDVLVAEGTNFARKMQYISSEEFAAVVSNILERYDRRVLFVSTHPADVESLLAFAEILWRYGYTVAVVKEFHARVIDKALAESGYEPSGELVFTPQKATIKALPRLLDIASLGDIKDRRCAFIIPPLAVKKVKQIASALGEETGGLLHILLTSEVAGEELLFEEKVVSSWLELLGVTEYRIHVSGHYHPYEFKLILDAVKPRDILPVHTVATPAMLRLFEKYTGRRPKFLSSAMIRGEG